MWVQSLRIEGFRSIQQRITLPLASRITILVGRNSTGKSNLLRALKLVSNFPTLAEELRDEDFSPGSSEIKIAVVVRISEAERKSVAKSIAESKVAVSRSLSDFSKGSYLRLWYLATVTKASLSCSYYLAYQKISKWHPLFSRRTSSPDNETLSRFQEMLKKHYLAIQCQDCFDRIPAEEQNEIAGLLTQQYMDNNQVTRTRYNEVRDALSFITEGIGGEIQPAQLGGEKSEDSEAKFQIRTEIEKKYYVPLPYMGEGAKRVALVLYHIVNSPCGIIGIEEPETNLHSGAQKRFRNTLDTLCVKYNKRIILTTHSTVFIDRWQSASVHKVDIGHGLTTLSHALERDGLTEVARLLGVSPGDALAADGIIWVEGPSDLAVYESLFRTIGTDLEANNISIMWVGGDALRHIRLAELKQLNPNFAVLIDSERTSARGGVPRWKTQFAKDCQEEGNMFFMTQFRSIENYFTLRAIRQYYHAPKIPAFGNYDALDAYIQQNLPGKSYSKMRDAGPIAKLMTPTEVENLGDLTAALHSVQTLISEWKHFK